MLIVPFKPEHIENIRAQGIQPAQQRYAEMLGESRYVRLLTSGIACSAVDGERVLVCSGVIEKSPDVGFAWALFPCDLGPLFIGVHRTVKRFLDGSRFRRIETVVDEGFAEGHRWIKLLGFERDGDVYARVRS